MRTILFSIGLLFCLGSSAKAQSFEFSLIPLKIDAPPGWEIYRSSEKTPEGECCLLGNGGGHLASIIVIGVGDKYLQAAPAVGLAPNAGSLPAGSGAAAADWARRRALNLGGTSTNGNIIAAFGQVVIAGKTFSTIRMTPDFPTHHSIGLFSPATKTSPAIVVGMAAKPDQVAAVTQLMRTMLGEKQGKVK